MLRQVSQLLQQGTAILIRFTHADDTTAADIDVFGTYIFQRVEAILIGTRGDDLFVVFG